MKITIEPTGTREECDNYPTVSVSVDTNESTISDIIPMLETVLCGWGFHRDSVAEILSNNTDDEGA